VKRKSRAVTSKPIELPARLLITQSADLHRTLLSACEKQAPLVLDGSRVEEIDTAILQLLLSAWLGAAKRGVACRWLGASEALRHAATLIGVAATLQLDGAAGPAAVRAVG
jgi:anti-anti-sigma regulatory factor